jgi:hypothetical protein
MKKRSIIAIFLLVLIGSMPVGKVIAESLIDRTSITKMQTIAGDAYYLGYYQLEGNNKILHRVFEGADKELGRVYIAKEQSPIYYMDAQAVLRILKEKYPNALMFAMPGDELDFEVAGKPYYADCFYNSENTVRLIEWSTANQLLNSLGANKGNGIELFAEKEFANSDNPNNIVVITTSPIPTPKTVLTITKMQTTEDKAYYFGYYQLQDNNKILHRVFEGTDKELGRVYFLPSATQGNPTYYIEAQAVLRLLQEKYPTATIWSMAGGLISALQDPNTCDKLDFGVAGKSYKAECFRENGGDVELVEWSAADQLLKTLSANKGSGIGIYRDKDFANSDIVVILPTPTPSPKPSGLTKMINTGFEENPVEHSLGYIDERGIARRVFENAPEMGRVYYLQDAPQGDSTYYIDARALPPLLENTWPGTFLRIDDDPCVSGKVDYVVPLGSTDGHLIAPARCVDNVVTTAAPILIDFARGFGQKEVQIFPDTMIGQPAADANGNSLPAPTPQKIYPLKNAVTSVKTWVIGLFKGKK